MELRIIEEPLRLDIIGFGATAAANDYVQSAFRLSGKMWPILREKNIPNEGKNIWVYAAQNYVFAGVLPVGQAVYDPLEQYSVHLGRYAYCRHTGPYQQIGQTAAAMRSELAARKLKVVAPYIEIYGHWTKDESKLETELIMAL